MAVLIKGMTLPRDCYECEFEHFNRCQLCSKAPPSVVESVDRPDFCPLRAADEDRWVPVTEGFPELNKQVLVYAVGKAEGFIGDAVTAITERFLFKFLPSSDGTEEWRSPWPFFLTDYKITHWRYLPMPPETDEYEEG